MNFTYRNGKNSLGSKPIEIPKESYESNEDLFSIESLRTGL
jgi:hypothetical protein